MRFTTILIFAATIGTASPALAQNDTSQDMAKVSEIEINLMRKDLRDQKKQIVAANMPLNGDEAAKFWPAYGAYTEQTIKINDNRFALMKEYAFNYTTMTDTQASGFIRRWIGVDDAATKLRLEWIPKFEQLLGAKKAAIFFQIDRRTGMMIDLQFASLLPLVQP
jgi:hypothetical protein